MKRLIRSTKISYDLVVLSAIGTLVSMKYHTQIQDKRQQHDCLLYTNHDIQYKRRIISKPRPEQFI
jgi:hypothetical protein